MLVCPAAKSQLPEDLPRTEYHQGGLLTLRITPGELRYPLGEDVERITGIPLPEYDLPTSVSPLYCGRAHLMQQAQELPALLPPRIDANRGGRRRADWVQTRNPLCRSTSRSPRRRISYEGLFEHVMLSYRLQIRPFFR